MNFTQVSNIFYLAPLAVCAWKSKWHGFYQLLFTISASVLQHMDEPHVLGLSSLQRFLWDFVNSTVLVYTCIVNAVTLGNDGNSVVRVSLLNTVLFLTAIMVFNNRWRGVEHDVSIALSVFCALMQYNKKYRLTCYHACSCVMIAIGCIMLFQVKVPAAHGIWHMCSAAAALFAFL